MALPLLNQPPPIDPPVQLFQVARRIPSPSCKNIDGLGCSNGGQELGIFRDSRHLKHKDCSETALQCFQSFLGWRKWDSVIHKNAIQVSSVISKPSVYG